MERMSTIIQSIASYIPPNRVTNDDLAQRMDTTDEWIRSHTGISARHFAPDGIQTSDMAAYADKKALEKAQLRAEDIDYLIVATATPDFFGFPSTACLVQDKIGAQKAAAFDVNAGCTGFIYALDVANAMIASSNANYALVVGSESLSRLVDWNDRSTAVLFGDGAGAAIVAKSNETHRGCISFILGAEGSGAKDLYLVQPERSRTFERPAPIVPYIYMNGKKVYDFAVRSITMLIEKMLQQTATSLDDFAWIVPHQANARIVQAAAKRLSIPLEKFYIDIEEYANTSAASIPIAPAEMSEKGLLKPNDLIMLVGFGAGLTYGAAALRW